MKNMTIFISVAVAALFAVSCYEGYTAADGGVLKQYLEPAKLKELTDKPKKEIWIVDVRPADAYRKAHIPTARSFPSGEIMNRLGKIPKTQYLILVCETGGRAQAVLEKLEGAGYTRMMNWGGASRYFRSYGSVSGEDVKR
jgi:rhodanese-related sulfurtransferase